MTFKNTILVVILLSLGLFSVVKTWAASPVFDDSLAATLLSKINNYRVSQGKTALKYSSKLAGIAKSRVSAVYTSQTFISSSDPTHTIPGFGSFSVHAKALGLNPLPTLEGENFAVSTRGVDGLYSNWLNSPSHLSNILDDQFVYTGIAISSNLEEAGDPIISPNITPGGLVGIQVFTTADAIDDKTPPLTASVSRPSENTSIKKSKPITTPKITTPNKLKIDNTQKVGSKLKFDEVAMGFSKIFN